MRGKNIDTAIPKPFETNILAKNMQLAGAPEILDQDWRQEQSSDKDIGPVIELINKGDIYNMSVRKETHRV